MRTLNWKSTVMWTALSLLFLLLALMVGPAPALAADATLYELTENMKLVERHGAHRKATSELMGTANAGTPLCPLPVGYPACTVNATGSDNISLATGLGNFGGTFTVVVQGDNPVDSPEYVIAKGKFHGKMDFSLAVLYTVPLGSVVGTMHLDGVRKAVPFTGTFRLPFVLPYPDAYMSWAYGWGSLPLAPSPFSTDKSTRPLYLGDDMQSLLPVQASEFGLGYPTVRFEIKF